MYAYCFLTWLYYQGLDHYAWCMCNIFTAKTNCGCFSPIEWLPQLQSSCGYKSFTLVL